MVSNKTRQKRATVHTLGCRLNQSESQIIREKLEEAGYRTVSFGDTADLAVINTCTVTREADAKSRQAIRQFIRANPRAFTAVVGCYSQMGAKAIAEISGVDLIIGNQDKLSVLDYVSHGKNERPVIVRDRIDREDFSIHFVGDQPFKKRANLKIQDGCDFMCSFCVIPYARGRARSRDINNLMNEAQNLVDRGVREIILTGVNIGTYNNQDCDIVAIVDHLNAITGLLRIRISSIEPTTIPFALFERMADPGHALLPYLHIPLQSGSDKILKLMRRKYAVSDIINFINDATHCVPDLCIGTDILVGFPGEGDKEFQETCSAFLNNPFTYCHVFPYSEREGTLAMRRTETVPVPERNRRGAFLRRLSAKRRYTYYESYLGKTMEVLFEDQRQGVWPGYTGNYIRVVCESNEDLTNRLARVRLEKISADFVEGSIVEVVN